jgi:hypothetical protein
MSDTRSTVNEFLGRLGAMDADSGRKSMARARRNLSRVMH